MFIRRTTTRTTGDGKAYFSYRLVRSRRDGAKVRQQTLLNLGSDFAVERRHWRMLCERISQLLSRQDTLLALACPEAVEREAQRIAAQLVGRSADVAGPPGGEMHSVDMDSLEMVRPRSVGVEHAGLWAMEQLGLGALLQSLGFNGPLRAAAMASIIGRMAVSVFTLIDGAAAGLFDGH